MKGNKVSQDLENIFYLYEPVDTGPKYESWFRETVIPSLTTITSLLCDSGQIELPDEQPVTPFKELLDILADLNNRNKFFAQEQHVNISSSHPNSLKGILMHLYNYFSDRFTKLPQFLFCRPEEEANLVFSELFETERLGGSFAHLENEKEEPLRQVMKKEDGKTQEANYML